MNINETSDSFCGAFFRLTINDSVWLIVNCSVSFFRNLVCRGVMKFVQIEANYTGILFFLVIRSRREKTWREGNFNHARIFLPACLGGWPCRMLIETNEIIGGGGGRKIREAGLIVPYVWGFKIRGKIFGTEIRKLI